MEQFWKWVWTTLASLAKTPVQPIPVPEPEVPSPKSPEPETGLVKEGAFYDQVRRFKLFGPVFSTSEFEGIKEILSDCHKAKWPLCYTAYALATAYHETSGTMQPIKEYGGYKYYMHNYDITGKDPQRARRMGNTMKGDGAKYCGRGYVQLTWKVNYQKAATELNLDLVNVPDLALDHKVASDIMIYGMLEGWFTGQKLSNYLPAKGRGELSQYVLARTIINGTDKAHNIADYALDFEEALVRGQWKH